jgi:hypothetical protein
MQGKDAKVRRSSVSHQSFVLSREDTYLSGAVHLKVLSVLNRKMSTQGQVLFEKLQNFKREESARSFYPVEKFVNQRMASSQWKSRHQWTLLRWVLVLSTRLVGLQKKAEIKLISKFDLPRTDSGSQFVLKMYSNITDEYFIATISQLLKISPRSKDVTLKLDKILKARIKSYSGIVRLA